MGIILLRQAQDALGVIDVLRNDPLLYLVVALPILGVLGMAWLYKQKNAELKDLAEEKKLLRAENAALVKSVMESQRGTTEAVTAQVEVMRAFRVDLRDSLSKHDQKAEQHNLKYDQIIKHLLEIKMTGGGAK